MFSDSDVLSRGFSLYDRLKHEADRVDVRSLHAWFTGFCCDENMARLKKYADSSNTELLRLSLNFINGRYLSDAAATDRYIALIKKGVFTERQWRDIVLPTIEVYEFNSDFKKFVPEFDACFERVDALADETSRKIYMNQLRHEFDGYGIFTESTLDNADYEKIETSLCVYSDLYKETVKDLYSVVLPFYNKWPVCLATIRMLPNMSAFERI